MKDWVRFLLFGERNACAERVEALGATIARKALPRQLARLIGALAAHVLYYSTAPFPPLRRRLYNWVANH